MDTERGGSDHLRTVRWGIAGPGRIAETFARDLALVEGSELVAVGSRSQHRATRFASKFGADDAHGSYRDLLANDAVDVVYIATPHRQHKALALGAIEAGKAVLVEKSFTATTEGTQQVIEAARTAGVFCMEAMWTRFLPVMVDLRQAIAEGDLGEVMSVQGDLFAHREFDAQDRIFDPALGGGATLDLGVYVLSFAQHFMGEPRSVIAKGELYPNGADATVAMLLGYPDQRVATLACSLQSRGPGRMVVMGTKGWAEVMPRFHHPIEIAIHSEGEVPRTVRREPTGSGYSHEIEAVAEYLRQGLTESPLMPLDDTLAVQRQLSSVLDQLGIHLTDDESVLD